MDPTTPQQPQQGMDWRGMGQQLVQRGQQAAQGLGQQAMQSGVARQAAGTGSQALQGAGAKLGDKAFTAIAGENPGVVRGTAATMANTAMRGLGNAEGPLQKPLQAFSKGVGQGYAAKTLDAGASGNMSGIVGGGAGKVTGLIQAKGLQLGQQAGGAINNAASGAVQNAKQNVMGKMQSLMPKAGSWEPPSLLSFMHLAGLTKKAVGVPTAIHNEALQSGKLEKGDYGILAQQRPEAIPQLQAKGVQVAPPTTIHGQPIEYGKPTTAGGDTTVAKPQLPATTLDMSRDPQHLKLLDQLGTQKQRQIEALKGPTQLYQPPPAERTQLRGRQPGPNDDFGEGLGMPKITTLQDQGKRQTKLPQAVKQQRALDQELARHAAGKASTSYDPAFNLEVEEPPVVPSTPAVAPKTAPSTPAAAPKTAPGKPLAKPGAPGAAFAAPKVSPQQTQTVQNGRGWKPYAAASGAAAGLGGLGYLGYKLLSGGEESAPEKAAALQAQGVDPAQILKAYRLMKTSAYVGGFLGKCVERGLDEMSSLRLLEKLARHNSYVLAECEKVFGRA